MAVGPAPAIRRMTPRERVRCAVNHGVPDRIPLDLGSTPVSGISASSYAKLRQALGFSSLGPVRVHEPYQILGEVEPGIREILGIDTVGLGLPTTMFGFRNENWKPWRLFDGTEVLVSGSFRVTEDENGDSLIHPKGDISAPPSGRMPRGGFYFDSIVRQGPLDEDNLDPREWAEEQYSVYTEEDLEYLQRRAAELYETTGLAIVGNFWQGGFGDIAQVPGPGIVHPRGIRDPEDWYMAHLLHPDYIKGIFEIQCEIVLTNLELYRQAAGDRIDVIVVGGTDFGTQQGTFMSPAAYREFYKPFHKRVNDWIHSHTKWRTLYHTCGSVVDILPDFAEAGLDILNPVQCSARGMDPETLKAGWGDRFVFWGGAVDTQKTLAFGTPGEIREEVAERLRVFGRDGGFVCGAIHNIQSGIPVDNIVAFFEAVQEFR